MSETSIESYLVINTGEEIISGPPHFFYARIQTSPSPFRPAGDTPPQELQDLAFLGHGIYQPWRDSIPDHVRDITIGYPAGMRWQILRYAYRVGHKRFIEEAAFNPAAIVVGAFYPNTELPHALIKKLDLETIEPLYLVHTWHRIEERWKTLKSSVRKALIHCPKITQETIACVLYLDAKVLSSAFILACSDSTGRGEIFDSVSNVLRLTNGEWRWRNVSSRKFLANLQFRLLPKAFGGPPLAPCEGMEPLDTPRDVEREALDQRNCLRTYLTDMAAGIYYAYRITEPERATLVIGDECQTARAAGPGPVWGIHALVGPGNMKVSEKLRLQIAEWLGCNVTAFVDPEPEY